MTHIKKALALTLFLFVFVLLAEAQNKNGNLTIIVKDQLDAIVADAEITLGRSEKKEKQTKTNRQGTSSFTKLEAGEYQITVTAKGFLDYKSESFLLKSGETKTLEVTLEVAPVESQVDITSQESSSPDDYAPTTVLTEEEIANLPDDPEEFMKALRRIAGESVTGGELPINVNGFEGERIPSKQQIQQIRIDRNAFSAATASGGGGIQIFTKAGADGFRGSVELGFADSRLNAANPFIGQRTPWQNRQYGINISGPLLKKKASFSLGFSRNENDTSAIINALILDNNLLPIEYKTFFRTPSRNSNVFGTINYDPAKKHKIYISFNSGQSRSIGQGVGALSLPERAANSSNDNYSLNIGHTYLGTGKFYNQVRFISRISRSRSFGESDTPGINVAESFSTGGSGIDNSSSNLYGRLSDDATYTYNKKISLRFGFDTNFNRISQTSKSNFNGTYSFNGRIAPLLDAANNPITDTQGNIITRQITSLESYRRTLLLSRLGYTAARIRELGGGADQFSISGGNPSISASQVEYSLYAESSYTLNKDMGVGIGLRYTGQTNLENNHRFSPRLSFNWAPKRKEKQSYLWSLPRVGVGFSMDYQGFSLGSVISTRLTNTDGRYYYFISAANAADPLLAVNTLSFFPNAPSIDLLTQLSAPRSRRIIADGFELPRSTNLNLTLMKSITKQFSINFTVNQSRSYRNSLTTNINAPLGGTFDATSAANAVYPYGSGGGTIYEQRSTGRAESVFYNLSMRLPQLKWRKRTTGFNISYSITKSRDNLVSGSSSPLDPYDFSREFAASGNDGVQSLRGFINQELPFGFSIGTNFGVRSGSRFNITTGRDSNRDGSFNERPAFASDPNKPGVISTIYGLLDPNPVSGDKIIPRNLGRGPRSIEVNASLSKTFKFGKEDAKNKNRNRRSLSFSVNAYNVFNITNRGNPIGNMSSPRFISIISGAQTEIIDDPGNGRFSVSRPRSFNFSMNLNF